MSVMSRSAGAALVMCATLLAADAAAFCGTFVSGAGEEMFNSATQVVLMRSGERTVLSMENDYQGAVQDFAMVVPVPVVLMQDDVKTLDPLVFRKVDVLGSPRLVEYAEKDPCQDRYDITYDVIGGCPWDGYYDNVNNTNGGFADAGANATNNWGEPPPPTVEAEFAVGEYEVVILSAEDATGLTTWLDANGYTLGSGATEVLDSYIQQGMYFFVAKVDSTKVTFDADGRALLSPLRFSYTSPDFSLPIRLGLLNSAGEQDLIVNILSTEGRYEVSNYPNAYVPTNQLVSQDTRESFGAFYDKLFSQTVAQNPGAVVTEYAWSWNERDAGPNAKCDPCPPPPEGSVGLLDQQDLASLGRDVLSQENGLGSDWVAWTLTRLHARYGKTGVDADLAFSLKGKLTGGAGTSGRDQSVTSSTDTYAAGVQGNRFQGRYIMHNVWPDEVTCEDPVRGRWIGAGEIGAAPGPTTSGPVADVPGMSVEDFYVATDSIPATGTPKKVDETIDNGPCTEPAPDWWDGEDPPPADGGDATNDASSGDGSGCAAAGTGAPIGAALAFMLSGLITFARRRRRQG